jgi:hypothetical protein
VAPAHQAPGGSTARAGRSTTELTRRRGRRGLRRLVGPTQPNPANRRPLGLGSLTSVFAAATRHVSSHPAAGLDAKREAAQVQAHGVSAGITGTAGFLGLALIVALVTGARRRTEPAVAESEPAMADAEPGDG